MRAAKPQAKKLVIKPFKEKPKLPENFEDESWDKLRQAVCAVHNSTPVAASFQELYGTVQDMCSHNLAPKVFAQLQEMCESHTAEMVGALSGRTSEPVEFLEIVSDCWNRHCSQMSTIREIFMFLDRSYVLQTRVRSLWELGVNLFRQNFETNTEAHTKTLRGLLTLIDRERRGDAVDRSLIKNLVRMYCALGSYTDTFLAPFVRDAEAFCAEESGRLLEEMDVSQYLRHVEKRLREESDRVAAYLSSSTRKPLIAAVDAELLQKHVATIIDRGFEVLMTENRIDDLARMYQLLGRVFATAQMKNAFTAYVKKVGTAIVMNENGDKDMVELLLDLKQRMDTIVTQAFESNEDFWHGLKDAFEHFINTRQNKPAMLVAKFIDAKLRAVTKTSSDEELENMLDSVMVVFRFIQGKDVFEAFYKKDLAKRLLMGKSASIDAEKSMISKLKQQCGAAFTNKLEGMFKDIDLSYDIMTSFKESAVARERLKGFDINVHVLTTGFWPNYTPAALNLPQEISVCQDTFRMFYLSKHSGRKLAWQHSLGHCTLKTRFPLGVKELQVSLFQTVILLMFNDKDDIPFKEIAESTGMEDKELRINLQSLACAKLRVLTKKPKGRDVEDADVFAFNTEFSNKLLRIKINTIQMKETPEEAANTTEKVFQDRQYQIDAAVVRIMKARKSLSHQLLLSELYKQLKFPVTPAALKKRIESLIEREYLERDASNATVYQYVA